MPIGLVSVGVLGALIGTLAGFAGPEPTVTAAFITTSLSVFGGLSAWVLKRFNPLEVIATSLAVLVFTASFAFMLSVSNDWREEESDWRHRKAEILHLKQIEQCSKAESYFDSERVKLGLPPLGPEYYCRKPPWRGMSRTLLNPF